MSIDRFKDKYSIDEDTGCWDWTGYVNDNGYGKFYINGKPQRAHRVSHELYNGEIPEGMCVCHKCDNRKCVNPEHLFIGTQSDNMKDASNKGRVVLPMLNGEDCGSSKLIKSQVMDIFKSPLSHGKLASKHSVSKATVWKIKTGQTWSHVTGLSG